MDLTNLEALTKHERKSDSYKKNTSLSYCRGHFTLFGKHRLAATLYFVLIHFLCMHMH